MVILADHHQDQQVTGGFLLYKNRALLYDLASIIRQNSVYTQQAVENTDQ
jgi:hypothetical protein